MKKVTAKTVILQIMTVQKARTLGKQAHQIEDAYDGQYDQIARLFVVGLPSGRDNLADKERTKREREYAIGAGYPNTVAGRKAYHDSKERKGLHRAIKRMHIHLPMPERSDSEIDKAKRAANKAAQDLSRAKKAIRKEHPKMADELLLEKARAVVKEKNEAGKDAAKQATARESACKTLTLIQGKANEGLLGDGDSKQIEQMLAACIIAVREYS